MALPPICPPKLPGGRFLEHHRLRFRGRAAGKKVSSCWYFCFWPLGFASGCISFFVKGCKLQAPSQRPLNRRGLLPPIQPKFPQLPLGPIFFLPCPSNKKTKQNPAPHTPPIFSKTTQVMDTNAASTLPSSCYTSFGGARVHDPVLDNCTRCQTLAYANLYGNGAAQNAACSSKCGEWFAMGCQPKPPSGR